MLKGGSKKKIIDNNIFWHKIISKIRVYNFGYGRINYYFFNNNNRLILKMTFDPLNRPQEMYYFKNNRGENHYITEEMYNKIVNIINLKRNEGIVEDEDDED